MTIIPNAFQCHNAYVDRAMPLLLDPELRILLFAVRHILGWQDRLNERAGHISIDDFQHGLKIKRKDGTTTRVGTGCGLSRAAIMEHCASLVELGFLIPLIERVGPKGQKWELSEEIHWDKLEQRSAERASANKQRTSAATAARLVSSDVTGNVPRNQLRPTSTSDVTGPRDDQSQRKPDRSKESLQDQELKESVALPPDAENDAPNYKQLNALVIDALKLGTSMHYGIVTKYTQFLIGCLPEKDSKKRSYGDFFEYQLSDQPMTPAEIIAFGCWLDLEDKPNIRAAETLNRVVAEFRDDPEYETLVRQAEMALRFEAGGEATESVPPDLPAALDAEKKDHSADIQSRLQRVSERMTR